MLNLIKHKTFGLEISEGVIRVAQLPDKFAQTPFSQGVRSVKLALKKAKIKSKRVIISIPEESSFTRLIPKDGSIKKEIQENVPFPINKIYYDWQETSNGIFISAATKKIVDEYITLLSKAGLIVQAIEPESIAITRAVITDNSNVMIIKIGKIKINFIIVSKQIIRFTASKKQPRDLSKEIKKYLKYYKISKIIICGNKTSTRGIVTRLKKDLHIKAELGKLNNKKIKCDQPMEYITAIGLVLRQ